MKRLAFHVSVGPMIYIVLKNHCSIIIRKIGRGVSSLLLKYVFERPAIVLRDRQLAVFV